MVSKGEFGEKGQTEIPGSAAEKKKRQEMLKNTCPRTSVSRVSRGIGKFSQKSRKSSGLPLW